MPLHSFLKSIINDLGEEGGHYFSSVQNSRNFKLFLLLNPNYTPKDVKWATIIKSTNAQLIQQTKGVAFSKDCNPV